MAARIATLTALLIFRPLRYWQFLLIAIALNFLSAIFHRRVCFQKNILASDFDILSKLLLDFKINLDGVEQKISHKVRKVLIFQNELHSFITPLHDVYNRNFSIHPIKFIRKVIVSKSFINQSSFK